MSQKLSLSFIDQDPFTVSKGSPMMILLLLLSLAALGYVGTMYIKQQRTLTELNEKLNQINSLLTRSKPVEVSKKNLEVKLTPQQTKQIKETVDELVISWDLLFQAIEQTSLQDVALLEISPNSKKKLIVLRGEAKNLKDVFAYIKALDDTPIFSKVYLQSHSVDETNENKPVSFTLSAEWLLDDHLEKQP